jgi:hypothetical protein
VSTCYSPAEQLLLGCLLRLRSLYRCAIGIRYAVPVSLPFRPLNHLTEDQPEITDLIVSHDPVTLERLPVRKESVLDTFASFENRRAIAAIRAIPDRNDFFGIYAAHLWETRLLGLIVLAFMLSVEIILNRLSSRRQSAEICSLV